MSHVNRPGRRVVAQRDLSKNYQVPSTRNKGNKIVKTLYISNLPELTTKRNLQGLFSIFGKIESSNMAKINRTCISADVTFVNPEDAEKAQEAASKNEIRYKGTVLNVVPAYTNDHLLVKYDCGDKGDDDKNPSKRQKKSHDNSKEQPKDLDLINKLNDDCLTHIFLRLSIVDRIRIERVCKRWQDVTRRGWHDVKELELPEKLKLSNPRINLKLIDNRVIENILIRCGRYLTCLKLTVKDLIHCDADVLSVIGKHCGNVNQLSLELCDLVNGFNHLRRFSTGMMRKLKNLNNLSMSGFTLKPHEVKAICDKGNLTSLSLMNCSLNDISDVINLQNLKYLNLTSVQSTTDVLLSNIADRCTHLEHLNVNHCLRVTTDGISVLTKLKNLKILHIEDLHRVDDSALVGLIKLEELHSERCHALRNPGLCKLFKCATNLRFVNLFCTSVTTEILIMANKVLKNRATKHLLRIIIRTPVLDEWRLVEDEPSPYLIVEGKDKWRHSDDDDDEDDDDDDEDDDDLDDDDMDDDDDEMDDIADDDDDDNMDDEDDDENDIDIDNIIFMNHFFGFGGDNFIELDDDDEDDEDDNPCFVS